jgi:hypothetical protein
MYATIFDCIYLFYAGFSHLSCENLYRMEECLEIIWLGLGFYLIEEFI